MTLVKWRYAVFAWLVAIILQPACANDIARQFSTDDFRSVLVGEQNAYVLRVDAAQPLSLGLTTVFVSPAGGKLPLRASLNLAYDLADKGWHVDIVSPHWFINAAASSGDTAAPAENEMATDNTMATDNKMAPENEMAEDGAMAKTAMMSWQSQLDPVLDHTALGQQLSLLLASLQNSTQDVIGFRLLIAEGMIASLLLEQGKNPNAPRSDAVTFISPFWPDTEINGTLATLTADYPTPLLDLGFASSNRFARHQQQRRAQLARVKVKRQYRQRMLPRYPANTAMAWVSGEIVGWTRSLGW